MTVTEKLFYLYDYLVFTKTIVNKNQFYLDTGIQRQNFHKIRSGDIKEFNIQQVEKIGKAYNVNYNWLFDGKGKEGEIFKTPPELPQKRVKLTVNSN